MRKFFLFYFFILLLGTSCRGVETRSRPDRQVASYLNVTGEQSIGLIVVGRMEYLELLPKAGGIIKQDLTARSYRVSFLKTEWAEEIIRPDIFFESAAGPNQPPAVETSRCDYFFLVKIVSLDIAENFSLKEKKNEAAAKKDDVSERAPRLVKSVDKKCGLVMEMEIYDGHSGLLFWQGRAPREVSETEEYPYSRTKSLDELVESLLKSPDRFDKIIEKAVSESASVLIDQLAKGDIHLDIDNLVKVYLNVYEGKAAPINLSPGVHIGIVDRTIDRTGQPVKRRLPDGLTIPQGVITKNTGSYELELPEGYYQFVIIKDNTPKEFFTLVIGQARNINLVLPEE